MGPPSNEHYLKHLFESTRLANSLETLSQPSAAQRVAAAFTYQTKFSAISPPSLSPIHDRIPCDAEIQLNRSLVAPSIGRLHGHHDALRFQIRASEFVGSQH